MKNTTHAPVNEHAAYAWMIAVYRRRPANRSAVGRNRLHWPTTTAYAKTAARFR